MIKLLIVDDQPDVRKGLQMRLAAEDDLTVIGEAADGADALDLVRQLDPDVVLLDVDMPRQDGIVTAGALHAACPHTSVIMLSIHDDACTRARAKSAGAAAFVGKDMSADSLLAAIRRVAH